MEIEDANKAVYEQTFLGVEVKYDLRASETKLVVHPEVFFKMMDRYQVLIERLTGEPMKITTVESKTS